MFNLSKKKFAFSLAEALITLLIVSLITIATIPVLTKKKRDPSYGSRGAWICTKNSFNQYVYWEKSNPVGDRNNPDTWRRTNTDYCLFSPATSPNNKYAVTVIGGGGGGGNGASVHEVLAKTTGGAVSFSPSKTELYDVILIGAGGGGGDYQGSDQNTAGGGGSGGKFEGSIPLYYGSSYTLYAGAGGKNGGSAYHGGLSNSTSHGWADNGGSSYLKYAHSSGDTKTDILVNGGGGGEGIGCSKWKCRGGSGGSAGSVAHSYFYTNVNVQDKILSSLSMHLAGRAGGNGNYYECHNNIKGGVNNFLDSGGNITSAGNGGHAGYNSYCGTRTGQYGTNGLATISKNWKKYGTGGSAAVPSSYFVPNIYGQIKVTIPDAAPAATNGGTTIAEFVKNGIIGRTFKGYGGAKGITDETINNPEHGEHSQYNMQGGGTAAPDCTSRKHIPAGYAPYEITTKKCTKIVCNVVSANTDEIRKFNVTSSGVQVLPTGFIKSGSKYILKQQLDSTSPEDIAYYQVYGNNYSNYSVNQYLQNIKINYFINHLYPTLFYAGNSAAIKSLFPQTNDGDDDFTEFAGYSNASDIYNKYACLRNSYITYEKACTDEMLVTETKQGYHGAIIQPAVCKENGGNGTSYGAGGGGGNASDSAGVFSKGGKGGYGAVIIEW